MDVSTRHRLNGERRAAIILVSLKPEVAAKVMKHLSDEEIESLTLNIANLTTIGSEEKESVIKSFYERCMAHQYMAGGGFQFAKTLLEKSLGRDKAIEIIEKLSTSVQANPLDFVAATDPNQLVSILRNEHPQTVALVMANIPPHIGAEILSSLPENIQPDVAMRLALMDRSIPDAIYTIERVLEKKLAGSMTRDTSATTIGGIKSLVDVLNNADRATEKTILEYFDRTNPDLAEEVKKLMFVFEDVMTLDDRSIQMMLRDIDTKDLALALKGASPEVKEVITKNMSERAGGMLEEEMEYLGPVRLKQVEEAQQRIVSIIRKLEEAGEIVIARGAEDEFIE